jgi:hypothetical protein
VPPIATFQAARASSPIVVDGVLDEQAWATATVVPLLYEWSPGDGVPPPVATECLVTYDQANLYVAFRAHDPDPGAIRAHLMDRDDTDTLIQDDHIGVMIDTFNDERRAFQFRVNPLGVQADAVFSEQDGVEDFSWDMIWDAKGRVGPEGYVVEIAFPLKQLRFQSATGPQTWGFEAFRSWPRSVRHRITSAYRDRAKVCLLCQENKLAGFEGLAQGRNLEFDPTATFGRTDTRAAPDDRGLTTGNTSADAGVTARWSVTPNFTFNGTVNPDFSQVEADVAQLDVNTRFALFYPEKRPFFLEGLDFFTTPIQAVFTRTVADPHFGAKLTGKQGSSGMGLFVARDRYNTLLLPSNQGSDVALLDDDVTTVVGRYRRDIRAGSSVGALYGGREANGYHNRQVGLDAYWRLTSSDAVRAQYLRADTRYPAEVVSGYGQAERTRGGAFIGDYQHTSPTWALFATFESYDRGFRSDTGFVPRVDFRNVFGQAQRIVRRGGGSWFNRIDVGVRGWRSTDADWDLTDETVAAFVNYAGPRQTEATFNMPRDVVVYRGRRYEYYRPNFYFGIKPTGGTSFDLFGRFGGGVDFDNNRHATRAIQFTPSMEYRPVSRVNLRLSHSFDQLDVEGGRLYRANLTQVRAIYHVNVRAFLRAILQYTDIVREPDLYTFPVDGRTRRLFSQYLFSLKLNPRTVLFLGYSDNWTGNQSIDVRQVNRTLFLKLGYAWVL